MFCIALITHYEDYVNCDESNFVTNNIHPVVCCDFWHVADLSLPEAQAKGIFGIPLRQSITYANVAISLIDEQGESYIYGYVPIVVAKCGVFLKEKGAIVLCY